MRRRLLSILSVLTVSLGMVAVVAEPASAASCRTATTVTDDYSYRTWDTNEIVWRDTSWRMATTTGCHDVNIGKVYDNWNATRGCAVMRIWWTDRNDAEPWKWVCQPYVVMAPKRIGSYYMVETLNRPFTAAILF